MYIELITKPVKRMLSLSKSSVLLKYTLSFFLLMLINLCLPLGIANATVIVTGTTKGVKYHPGHYLNPTGLKKSVDGYIMKETYKEMSSSPVFKGIELQLKWAEVENDDGTLNTGFLDAHLAKLNSYPIKRRLIIFLNTKTINLTEKLVPAYLTNTLHPDYKGAYQGGIYAWGNEVDGTNPKVHKGNATKLWIPEVRDRLISVMEKLGAKYNAHPLFEGIGLNETAMGMALTGTTLAQENAFYQSLLDIQKKMKLAFPNTMTFQYTNYPNRILSSFIMGSTNSLKSIGVALGGPDVWLNDPGVNFKGTQYVPPGVYHYYPLLSGVLPLSPAVMSGNYRCSRADCNNAQGNFDPTARQLLDYARDKLKANYIFWMRDTALNKSRIPNYKEMETMLKNLYSSLNSADRDAVKLDERCPSMYAPCIID